MPPKLNGARLCHPIALSPQVTSPQPKLRRPNIKVVSPQHRNRENLYVKFQASTSQATCFSKARCTSEVVRV